MGSPEHCQWSSFCSHYRLGWTFCSPLQIGHLLPLAALGSQQDRVSLRSPTLVTNDLAVWGSERGLNLFLHITFSCQTHTVYCLADTLPSAHPLRWSMCQICIKTETSQANCKRTNMEWNSALELCKSRSTTEKTISEIALDLRHFTWVENPVCDVNSVFGNKLSFWKLSWRQKSSNVKYLHVWFQVAETLSTSKLQLRFALCVYTYTHTYITYVLSDGVGINIQASSF